MGKTNKIQNKSHINNEAITKKKKDKIRLTKELDMLKFKQKINDEIKNNISPDMNNFIQNNEQKEKNYSSIYKHYINEEFSPLCIVFINRIISNSESLNSDIKNNNEIHKILLSLTKQLMMNEYELTIFSMLLDEFGWSNINFSLNDYLMFVGFFVKKLSSDDGLIIFDYIKKIDNSINDKYSNWKKIYNDKIKNHSNFTYSEVNKRFKLLKKPFNIYCQNNFIDYNNIVEKILKMSLPYNENKHKENEDIISVEEGKKIVNKKQKKINFQIKKVPNITDNPISEISNVNNSCNKNLEKKINENIVQFNNNGMSKKINTEEILNLNINNLQTQNINNNNNSINMINPYFQGFNFYSNSHEKKNDCSYNYLIPQNNQSQQSLSGNIQIKNPSLIDLNMSNIARKSLQSFHTLENDEDNLKNFLNHSNHNFFQSGLSLNNVYENNLDFFNLNSPPIFSNKFDNFSEIKLNDNNNNQVQNQNNHLLDNVFRNNNNKVYGILNNNYSINYNNNNQFSPVFQIPVNNNNINLNNINNNIYNNQNLIPSSFIDNEGNKDKKNLLGIYNQLKKKELNKK